MVEGSSREAASALALLPSTSLQSWSNGCAAQLSSRPQSGQEVLPRQAVRQPQKEAEEEEEKKGQKKEQREAGAPT